MLSNFDIQEKANRLKIPLFRGVYSKDKLPTNGACGSYVINLESEYDDKGKLNQGSHWTALFINKNHQAGYFDSFGFQAPQEILNLCKKRGKLISWSNKEIQDIDTDCCGWYCLAFCAYMSNHTNNNYHEKFDDIFQSFVNQFSDDPKKNQQILFKLIPK